MKRLLALAGLIALVALGAAYLSQFGEARQPAYHT